MSDSKAPGRDRLLRLVEPEQHALGAEPPAGEPPVARAPDELVELARAAAQGRPEAIRVLFLKLAPRVARGAAAVLGPTSPELDDVVQEALLRLFRALPSFREESSVAFFAQRIAVRVAIDHGRANQRRERVESVGEDWRQVAASTPEESAEQGQERLRILALLDELSDVQAETLLLRVVEGYSLKEIALAMGVPENTVRSRIRLAKDALKRRVSEDPELSRLCWRDR